MRLIVLGAGGRMGRTLVRVMAETPGVTLAGAVDQEGSDVIGTDAGVLAGIAACGVLVSPDLAGLVGAADGVVDFSRPAASLAALATAPGLVHVIGTTGFSVEQEREIKAASGQTTIVRSGNMSLGINLLAALVAHAAGVLDNRFDIEIVEIHHNQKVDAPSGTAMMLGHAAAKGRGIDLAEHAIFTREGETGPRPKGPVGFASVRGGTVIGDHTVIFAGPGERLELTHRAEDRTIFARGALHAALWARRQPAGLYGMADVLAAGSGVSVRTTR